MGIKALFVDDVFLKTSKRFLIKRNKAIPKRSVLKHLEFSSQREEKKEAVFFETASKIS